MLGLVTLYNPDPIEAVANMKRYAYDLDILVVWDNSPLEKKLRENILENLSDITEKIVWKGDGENHCIALAINYAWQLAREKDCQLLLLMDQDSQWEDFSDYREKIEDEVNKEHIWAFTPFFPEHDMFNPSGDVEFRKVFINSGTVLPVCILDKIGGADEAFPLDALDTDLSYRIRKAGYKIACLPRCILHHTIGHPVRKGPLHIFTNDYGPFRTYSITRSHIISYRKHRDIMTAYERRKFFKEIFWWKFVRLVLAEEEKVARFKMFFKGIWDGVTYKISK